MQCYHVRAHKSHPVVIFLSMISTLVFLGNSAVIMIQITDVWISVCAFLCPHFPFYSVTSPLADIEGEGADGGKGKIQ